ncbi:bifunctional 3,4-dihydroxy-2-butanone-4-phosphate synthase/GTP cyclohydrolase II [Sulfuriferula thiophila]|uniref:bifunctional 3,4-dihydroxy-2-butanone-4-phosphate synthase/GTP cyclohydrolase II n=1 Tax=Sulfuriferula thiophila TaxID=1781211 RepID=UPI000F60E754|nr:bifunctional 3,4-dihydroxy-2-butanone-4-phosphate synthase/GTP cyclohydrolase II [Sulfuriferula thiophila]
MSLSPIEDIIADIKAGKMVVLVDEEDRENEGDLVMAAEFATPEAINFMAKYGRGLVCLTLTDERCKQLGLRQMVADNQSPYSTAFTISIEAAEGVTTGISAADRACTIQAAVAKHAKATDIIQPGHIFPLRAQPGGVLIRAGHTEAGCDLASIAGLEPAAVICEILKEDGSMARLPDLIEYAREHGLKIGAIVDLIHYRNRNESLIERVGSRVIETAFGEFNLIAYREKISGAAHLALVKGDIHADTETLVRVHEPVSVMDVLEMDSALHAYSVNRAMQKIADAGKGVVVLLHRAETASELLSHALPSNEPKPAQKWDVRNYGIGAQILKDVGVGKMRLLATQRKMPSMAGFDLEVTGYSEGN